MDWKDLLRTREDWGLTIARVALAVVIGMHGLQKLGAFGGPGLGRAYGMFTTAMHLPPAVAVLPILAETVGCAALLLGLLGRLAGLALAVEMLVAALMVHAPNGFFMNWMGNQHGEGFEYHVLAIALGLVVTLGGSGALSIDRWLTRGTTGRLSATFAREGARQVRP